MLPLQAKCKCNDYFGEFVHIHDTELSGIVDKVTI